MSELMYLIEISASKLTVTSYNSTSGTITDPINNVSNPSPIVTSVNVADTYLQLSEEYVPNTIGLTRTAIQFLLLETKHPLANVNSTNLDTNSTGYSSDMETYFSNIEDSFIVVGSGGTAGGASTLNELTDVTLTSPSNDQFLRYDGSKWVNVTVSISGGSSPDYTTAGLASTSDLDNYLPLAGGTMTGDLTMTEGDDIVIKYSGWNNRINTLPLTTHRDINFPNLSGTVALTSQLGSGNDYTTAGLASITYVDNADTTLQNQIDDLESATTGINTSLNILDTRVDNLEASTSGGGGGGASVTTIASPSSPYAPTNGNVIIWDTTSGDKIVNLPPASSSFNFVINIKKIDNSVNTITINGNDSETIDGDLSTTLTTQYESITIVCDGSNWYIT